MGVAVSGSYAYVADRTSGLRVIDISNPASPILSRYLRHFQCPGRRGQRLLRLRGGRGFRPAGDRHLQSRLTDPQGHLRHHSSASGVAVSGSYAYVADGVSGLRVIDISNPASPTLKGTLRHRHALGVAVSGSYAYVAEDRGPAGDRHLQSRLPDPQGYLRHHPCLGSQRSAAPTPTWRTTLQACG